MYMLVCVGTRPFCAGADAVIIEANDCKEPDVIYRALSTRGHVDMIKTAEGFSKYTEQCDQETPR